MNGRSGQPASRPGPSAGLVGDASALTMRHPCLVSEVSVPLGREDPGLERPHRRDTRLDNYVDRYAARTHGMTASAIRALFAVANRPEVVSLAGGMPNIADLPLDVVGYTLDQLVLRDGRRAMQYGIGPGRAGDPRGDLRGDGRSRGSRAHPEDVDGDRRLPAGAWTWSPGSSAIPATSCSPRGPVRRRARGVPAPSAQVVHVAMDERRADPGRAVRAPSTALRRPVNGSSSSTRSPTSRTRPASPRPWPAGARSSRSAERAGVLVVEDNPYGQLGFDGEPMPACARRRRRGLYLGTFSKTFAPGLRVGWMLAPHAVREKLVLAQESADAVPERVRPVRRHGVPDHHAWRGQIKIFREMYRERRDAMLAGLADHMPAGTSWTNPGRALRLGDPARRPRLQAMMPRAIAARVAYVPGTGLLRRRLRQPAHAAVLLLPHAGTDHRGHPAARRGAWRTRLGGWPPSAPRDRARGGQQCCWTEPPGGEPDLMSC